MAKVIAHIPKNATPKQIEEAMKKIARRKRKKDVSKHFGALKRGIDGLKYQKKLRGEWK